MSDENVPRTSVPNDFINNFGKNITKAIRAVKKLHHQNRVLSDTIERMVIESVKSGEHLKEEVFIPEYLGFTMVEVTRDHETRPMYCYKGSDIIMMKKDDDYILFINNQPRIVTIKNMYEGIEFFRMMGINISIDMYISGKLYVSRRPEWEKELADSFKKTIGA